jgi:hypothetical protein
LGDNRLFQSFDTASQCQCGTDYRNAQCLPQDVQVQAQAQLLCLIQQVYNQHGRQSRLYQLQRHREHALDILSVYHMDDKIRSLFQQDALGDAFLL